MRIAIDNEDIVIFEDHHKDVIKNDIHSDIFDLDMERRVIWSIEHPVINLVETRKSEWAKHFKDEYPSNPLQFAIQMMDLPSLDTEFEGSDMHVSRDGVVFYIIPLQIRKFVYRFIDQDPSYFHEKIKWILTHKYERCMERLRRNWESKLGENVPVDCKRFCDLVFKRDDYKNRTARESSCL